MEGAQNLIITCVWITEEQLRYEITDEKCELYKTIADISYWNGYAKKKFVRAKPREVYQNKALLLNLL